METCCFRGQGIRTTFLKVGLFPFARNWVESRSDLFSRAECYELSTKSGAQSNQLREHMFNCREDELNGLMKHPSLYKSAASLAKDTGVNTSIILRALSCGVELVKELSICLPPVKDRMNDLRSEGFQAKKSYYYDQILSTLDYTNFKMSCVPAMYTLIEKSCVPAMYTLIKKSCVEKKYTLIKKKYNLILK